MLMIFWMIFFFSVDFSEVHASPLWTTMTGLLSKVLLLGFLLVVFSQDSECQPATLDIFGPTRQADFVVSVGSGMPFELSLFQSTDAVALSGNVSSVVVGLNGGLDNSLVESITSQAPANTTLSVDISAANDVYSFQLVALGSRVVQTEDYRSLIANLVYVSNLTNDALADPPRNITITASGPEGTSSPATAVLQLLVANQAPPNISSRTMAAVDEDISNGAMVVELSATDPEGLGVIFSLVGSSSVFAVSSSGVVTVLDNSQIDYEVPAQRLFTLTVAAADTDPVTPMTSQTALTITINNVNDNPPRFSLPMFEFGVNEAVPNAVVGTLTATDDDFEDDADTAGNLFYDFTSPDSAVLQRFQINRITGVITAGSPLDFEDIPMFTFQVGVSDGLFSDTATVNVRVIDIPDNRPVISPATKTILVDRDTNQREVFLTSGSGGLLTVSDSDSPVLVGGVATVVSVRGSQVRLN